MFYNLPCPIWHSFFPFQIWRIPFCHELSLKASKSAAMQGQSEQFLQPHQLQWE